MKNRKTGKNSKAGPKTEGKPLTEEIRLMRKALLKAFGAQCTNTGPTREQRAARFWAGVRTKTNP